LCVEKEENDISWLKKNKKKKRKGIKKIEKKKKRKKKKEGITVMEKKIFKVRLLAKDFNPRE